MNFTLLHNIVIGSVACYVIRRLAIDVGCYYTVVYYSIFGDRIALALIMGVFGILADKYKYEDYPDGTHCIYKTACVTRCTMLAGE